MKTSKPATPKKSQPIKPAEENDPGAVDAFLAQLDHPLKADLIAIRAIILSADRTITEGIKWNSPSFYRHGWFATCNVRSVDSILIIFHLGAKVRDNSTSGVAITDPAGLLQWVAKERAVAKFKSGEAVAKKVALKSVVRQWTQQQSG